MGAAVGAVAAGGSAFAEAGLVSGAVAAPAAEAAVAVAAAVAAAAVAAGEQRAVQVSEVEGRPGCWGATAAEAWHCAGLGRHEGGWRGMKRQNRY